MVAALYLVFVYVSTEAEMGIVQRIFYIMVPSGWLAMLSFLIIFISSILYLTGRAERWDILAYSAAEIGIIFTTLTLISGSIWAKPAWGVWWDWGTPRLTSTLVLWFIYLTYFVARSFAAEESRGARFAAVVGIIGFIDIPIVALTIILPTLQEPGLHPPALIFSSGGLAPDMRLTLMVSIFAFTALYALLLIQRVSLKHDEVEVKRLKEYVQG
ncbi:MAG: cytochrome c biogenesis protein [Dehalococcoidales bacterium]|nr:cytochrome c biogenesis protein [Dehalococcoidales bacterium]